jgi:hypothetical protein
MVKVTTKKSAPVARKPGNSGTRSSDGRYAARGPSIRIGAGTSSRPVGGGGIKRYFAR